MHIGQTLSDLNSNWEATTARDASLEQYLVGVAKGAETATGGRNLAIDESV